MVSAFGTVRVAHHDGRSGSRRAGRTPQSRGANRYARLCLGIAVKDAASGFRVYRTPALRRILERPITSDGYGFQIELVFRAPNLGLSMGEAPPGRYTTRIHPLTMRFTCAIMCRTCRR
jgi:hypothetical protein